MKFVVKEHQVRPGQMVEVFDDDGTFLAGIYATAVGLHIASKHYRYTTEDKTEYPPSVMIFLKPETKEK